MRLTANKQDVQGWNGTGEQTYNYTSGMVATVRYNYETYTHTPFATTYGFFEARMKLPAGQGLWPAFWLLEEDQTAPPEIDIMEFLGHDKTTMHMNYHYLESGHQQAQTSYTGPDFTSGWHTYGVNWEPGKITWYVDGIARKTFTGNQVTDKPMYMIMNLAVGGSWPGDPDMTTPFPAVMEVDYVRVYKLGTAAATPPSSGGTTATAPSTSTTNAQTATGTTPTTNTATTSSTPEITPESVVPEQAPGSEKSSDTTSTKQPNVMKASNSKQTIAVLAGFIGIVTLIGASVFYALHHRTIRRP